MHINIQIINLTNMQDHTSPGKGEIITSGNE